jgi:hypothetical protein
MTLAPVIERVQRTATLVIRPVDALKEALARPTAERGPVRPVQFGLVGRVTGAGVEPLPRLPRPVQNLSGDTVFRDLELDPGTYRLELVGRPDPRRGDLPYEKLAAPQRDLLWGPAVPAPGLPGLPNHPTRLVELRLFPTSAYRFPPGSTLVRGTLLWYDGSTLAGAVVAAAGAILPQGRLGPRGDFVVAIAAGAAAGTIDLALDLTGVDAAARPDGAAYLASVPALWPAPWQRAGSSSVRQGALTGRVTRADGRAVAGASVTLGGHPGAVQTDAGGRWTYCFPPAAAAGTATITVQHPGFADVVLPNIPYPADATSAAPVVVLS